MFPAVIRKKKKMQSQLCINFCGNTNNKYKKCHNFCQRIAKRTNSSRKCLFLCALFDQPIKKGGRSCPLFGVASCEYVSCHMICFIFVSIQNSPQIQLPRGTYQVKYILNYFSTSTLSSGTKQRQYLTYWGVLQKKCHHCHN